MRIFLYLCATEMKIDLKNTIERSWDLLTKTSLTWDRIAVEKENSKTIRKEYVFVWFAISTLLVFLTSLIYVSDRKIEFAFLKAVITAVSLFGGYFIANHFCFIFLKKKNIEDLSKDNCEKIVAYSFTTIFVLKVLLSLMPSLFFLQVLVVHCAYLAWEGLRAILNLDENERGNIILVFSLIIILSPMLISWILNFMLPNA